MIFGVIIASWWPAVWGHTLRIRGLMSAAQNMKQVDQWPSIFSSSVCLIFPNLTPPDEIKTNAGTVRTRHGICWKWSPKVIEWTGTTKLGKRAKNIGLHDHFCCTCAQLHANPSRPQRGKRPDRIKDLRVNVSSGTSYKPPGWHVFRPAE